MSLRSEERTLLRRQKQLSRMKEKTFTGIFPALLTPFDGNGNVNRKALAELVRYNIGKGVSGFYVGGSTAEAFLLTDDERNTVYETVAEAADGKVTLIAHVGTISTDAAVRFAKVAERLGYDAISAISPFYYKFSFEQIKKHYYTIVDSVDMPMLVYNFPNFSGVNLTVPQVSEFFCDSRFIGIKHTSNDFFALEEFKKNFPDRLVYNGFDEMFLSGLSMGADGGIGSTYNFMAEKYIDIMRLYHAGDMAGALEVQREANRILTILCKYGIMETEKEVLCQLGFDFGKARMPFSELDDAVKAELKREITDRL